MARRTFNREFKLAAVKLVINDELPVSYVSKELNIHYNSLYRWIHEYDEYGESAFPGRGCTIYNYQTEIRKLQKRNKELTEELELLKKFRAFLKRNHV
jgi:transposase